MAQFIVKYQAHNKKTKVTSGIMIDMINNASGVSEAKQLFKSRHREQAPISYKIVSVVKSS